MNKWFAGIKSIEELRKRYRELLKKYHPDNGGDVSIMQEINSQYDALFDVLSRSESVDGKSYTKEDDEQFRAILDAISGFNMTVEIIGDWVWCFNCYAYKDRLKELGFKFAPKKKAWTWHSEPYCRHHKGELSLDKIKSKYGCKTVRNHSQQFALD